MLNGIDDRYEKTTGYPYPVVFFYACFLVCALAKRKSHSRLKMACTFIRILVHLRQMPRQQL